MFGLSDLLSLIISVFIILPVVTFIRESGYFIISALFGVQNPRLTIGSGPRFRKVGIFDVRRYYHMYSWFSFDSLKRDSTFAYICIYAGPILINLVIALAINMLLANGYLADYRTFFERFIFYVFYYVLLDVVPMFTLNGKPNNGMILYEMMRYGKRIDHNNEPIIPATTDVEEEVQEQMEQIKEVMEEDKKE